jgi:hypothetical protein
VLSLSLAQGITLWCLLPGGRPLRPRNLALMIGAGVGLPILYLAGVSLLDRVLADTIARPVLAIASPGSPIGMLLLAMFGAALLAQTFHPAIATSGLWTRFYVLLHNGFYLGAIQNRLVGRLWPPLPEPAASSTPSPGLNR